MKNKAYDISSYTFQENQVYLIDANIWLYIQGPPSNSQANLGQSYSAALKKLLGANSKIVINSLIMSEYLNRYCRIVFDALHKVNFTTFKDFRNSSTYLPTGQDAAMHAKTLLQLCDKCNDDFETIDSTKVLADFEIGDLDFNDGLIVESCKKNGWILITHDKDFINGGIDILTMNTKLLAACP